MSSAAEYDFETELKETQQELNVLGQQISDLKKEILERGHDIDKLEKQINIKQTIAYVLVCSGIMSLFFPYAIILGVFAIGSAVGFCVNISKQNKKFQADYNSLVSLELTLKNLQHDYYNAEFKISVLQDRVDKHRLKESLIKTEISQANTQVEPVLTNNCSSSSDDSLNC